MQKKKIIVFLLLFCFGCSHQPKAPAVHVSVVNNGSVQFTGLDAAIIGEIGRDTTRDVWENLIPVYKMPADTDMKDFQPVQHGAYQIKDSVVMFTPDTPFVKGHTYFMRHYQFEGGIKPWDLLKGKKKLGSIKYEDLLFKD